MVIARKGNLVARIADNCDELKAAQHLRYQVFYEEMSARADETILRTQRDADAYDRICDHLVVVRQTQDFHPDMITVKDGELVGTYRLLGQETAQKSLGFYSQREFDLQALIDRKPAHRFLELGRSCVLKQYRTKPVVELLWQGIWNYLRQYRHNVMVGCASLEGTDSSTLQLPLSFLYHGFRPPEDWNVMPEAENRVEIPLLAKRQINQREALKSLPPLIKGYLRLGAWIADGAVTDQQFNTTDVLIILPVSSINPRYFTRFGAPDDYLDVKSQAGT